MKLPDPRWVVMAFGYLIAACGAYEILNHQVIEGFKSEGLALLLFRSCLIGNKES